MNTDREVVDESPREMLRLALLRMHQASKMTGGKAARAMGVSTRTWQRLMRLDTLPGIDHLSAFRRTYNLSESEFQHLVALRATVKREK